MKLRNYATIPNQIITAFGQRVMIVILTAVAKKMGLRQEIDAEVNELPKDVHAEAVMETIEKIESGKSGQD